MIRDTKAFFIGLIMLVSFMGVYAYMMSPSFGNGRNGLEFADDMFNSISKGSVYDVIQSEIKKVDKWNGDIINVTLNCQDVSQADRWSNALQKVEGAEVSVDKEKVAFKGDLGLLLTNISQDCTNMFDNNGDVVKQKYNTDPRDATNRWYSITKAMVKDLEKQEKFKESVAIQQYQKKVIEPAYNYYGVDAKQVADNKGVMTFMMVFYLVYTLWYGFAIYYLCQGLGITMSKSGKKQEA
ncbi:conserved hypothetical protein [Desulforamulus reducens MI-1]|uniref:Uncharacterized protein n=1 Tax=Desulforamulus reducens (strain ATCC BAA-1160 / DSM 100696 / MI-1) TaxID=349161 RepID=A4J4F3_DESRM|nr:hypothetical protein [Desulforamulus reducens]ABO49956.1 conserved hypothetical protein [Desulforamulus reducens MI-1]